MARIISPAKSDLSALRQPLEEGERRVLEFFDARLPQQWKIYIQPHPNGPRPDFVLLHPRAGLAVFGVKNLNLDAVDRWVQTRPGHPPILMGRKGDRVFDTEALTARIVESNDWSRPTFYSSGELGADDYAERFCCGRKPKY